MPLLVACVLLAASAAFPSSASAQSSVFLVRHAERADTGGMAKETDPALSAAGQARAESLAATLRDAGITAIFTTEYQRTKLTAAPLAKALGVEITVVPSKDLPGLVERLKTVKGNALVVGHSNTIPEVARALGVKEPLAIADNEFDHLFVAVRDSRIALLHLRYK